MKKRKNLLEVCHDVLMNIDEVAVKQHIFVVKYFNSDFILERSWRRMTRARMTNRDDESYHVKIKSLDERRMIEFVAVLTQHEQIQKYVRSSIQDDEFFNSLKVEEVCH